MNSWIGRTASAVLATSRASAVLHAYTKTTDAAKLRVGDPNRSPNRLQSLSCAICALTCKPTHDQMLQKLISRSHLALTPISPAPASRPWTVGSPGASRPATLTCKGRRGRRCVPSMQYSRTEVHDKPPAYVASNALWGSTPVQVLD